MKTISQQNKHCLAPCAYALQWTYPSLHATKLTPLRVLLSLLFQDAAEQKAAVQFRWPVFIPEPSRHTEEDPLLLSRQYPD